MLLRGGEKESAQKVGENSFDKWRLSLSLFSAGL